MSPVPRFRTVTTGDAIELHDDECEDAFHRAVAPFPAEVTRVGDLTVWRRLTSG